MIKSRSKNCSVCHGTGMQRCPACNGTGKRGKVKCLLCHGAGRLECRACTGRGRLGNLEFSVEGASGGDVRKVVEAFGQLVENPDRSPRSTSRTASAVTGAQSGRSVFVVHGRNESAR